MIDLTKKYKLHGDVFEYDGFGSWTAPTPGGHFNYGTAVMQRFITEGYAVEVRKLKVAIEDRSPIIAYDGNGYYQHKNVEGVLANAVRDAAGGFDAVVGKTFSLSAITFTAEESIA